MREMAAIEALKTEKADKEVSLEFLYVQALDTVYSESCNN